MRDPKIRLRGLSEIATNPQPSGLFAFGDPVLAIGQKTVLGALEKRI